MCLHRLHEARIPGLPVRLMAGGWAGVDLKIAILRGEIERTLKLLGVPSLGEFGPKRVTQLQRLVPRSSHGSGPEG